MERRSAGLIYVPAHDVERRDGNTRERQVHRLVRDSMMIVGAGHGINPHVQDAEPAA